MLVKAKKLGYYEHKRRKEGDVFPLVSAKDFSDKWMEKVGSDSEHDEEKPVQVKAKRGKAAAQSVAEEPQA